jgi:hypothetical protein
LHIVCLTECPYLAVLCCATVLGGVGAGIVGLLAIVGWVYYRMTSVRRAKELAAKQKVGFSEAVPRHSTPRPFHTMSTPSPDAQRRAVALRPLQPIRAVPALGANLQMVTAPPGYAASNDLPGRPVARASTVRDNVRPQVMIDNVDYEGECQVPWNILGKVMSHRH